MWGSIHTVWLLNLLQETNKIRFNSGVAMAKVSITPPVVPETVLTRPNHFTCNSYMLANSELWHPRYYICGVWAICTWYSIFRVTDYPTVECVLPTNHWPAIQACLSIPNLNSARKQTLVSRNLRPKFLHFCTSRDPQVTGKVIQFLIRYFIS